MPHHQHLIVMRSNSRQRFHLVGLSAHNPYDEPATLSLVWGSEMGEYLDRAPFQQFIIQGRCAQAVSLAWAVGNEPVYAVLTGALSMHLSVFTTETILDTTENILGITPEQMTALREALDANRRNIDEIAEIARNLTQSPREFEWRPGLPQPLQTKKVDKDARLKALIEREVNRE